MAQNACLIAVSAVIGRLFYLVSLSFSAIVGATMGAMLGFLVGLKKKTGCVRGAAGGSIDGCLFAINATKLLFFICSSDDSSLKCLLQSIYTIWKVENKIGFNFKSRDSDTSVPKMRITEANNVAGDKSCCPICLEDLVRDELVYGLACCPYAFHLECLEEWLVGHRSCPLCRRNLH